MDIHAAVGQARTENVFHCRQLFGDTRLQLFERVLRLDGQVYHSPGSNRQYANDRDIPQGVIDSLSGSAWAIQHRHRIPEGDAGRPGDQAGMKQGDSQYYERQGEQQPGIIAGKHKRKHRHQGGDDDIPQLAQSERQRLTGIRIRVVTQAYQQCDRSQWRHVQGLADQGNGHRNDEQAECGYAPLWRIFEFSLQELRQAGPEPKAASLFVRNRSVLRVAVVHCGIRALLSPSSVAGESPGISAGRSRTVTKAVMPMRNGCSGSRSCISIRTGKRDARMTQFRVR